MIAEISKAIIKNKQEEEIYHFTGKHLCEVLEKYGKNVAKQAGALDDVCER